MIRAAININDIITGHSGRARYNPAIIPEISGIRIRRNGISLCSTVWSVETV